MDRPGGAPYTHGTKARVPDLESPPHEKERAMNLGGEQYGKRFRLRSEKNRRWAKMRREQGPAVASAPSSEAAVEQAGSYLAPDAERKESLKRAAIAAIVVHFVLFAIIVPVSAPEVIPLERTAATVVKRYTPPAPPAKAKKTRTKKKAAVVPIPDPTPDDPEPIELESSEEYDYGEFDEEFAIGEPSGIPGVSSGARDGAFRAGEGGVAAPVPIRQIDPEYTAEATRKGIQGEVWIEAVVDVNGNVVEPRLLRGLPDDELNRRAMEAIQRWTFRPGMKDGQPVAVIAVFTVTYRLH